MHHLARRQALPALGASASKDLPPAGTGTPAQEPVLALALSLLRLIRPLHHFPNLILCWYPVAIRTIHIINTPLPCQAETRGVTRRRSQVPLDRPKPPVPWALPLSLRKKSWPLKKVLARFSGSVLICAAVTKAVDKHVTLIGRTSRIEPPGAASDAAAPGPHPGPDSPAL